MRTVNIVAYASDIAANIPGCSKAPNHILSKSIMAQMQECEIDMRIANFVKPNVANKADAILQMCSQIANTCYRLTAERQSFCVLGGDHSSAIGTWSGVSAAQKQRGDIGVF